MKILRLTLILALAGAVSSCRTADEKAVAELAGRVLGLQAKHVVFEQIASDEDV